MMVVPLIIRVWLGSLFVYSAALKFVRYEQAGRLARPYGVMPKRLAGATGFALPWAEGLAAFGLLSGRLHPLGPVVGTSLGASFAYSAAHVVRRRADIPCGCTGDGDSGDHVTRITLARALVIMSCSLLILGTRRRALDGVSPPLGAAITIVSLLPAVAALRRRVREARQREQRARQQARTTEQLTCILAMPPTDTAASGDEKRLVAQAMS